MLQPLFLLVKYFCLLRIIEMTLIDQCKIKDVVKLQVTIDMEFIVDSVKSNVIEYAIYSFLCNNNNQI
jgi:hypothetical protein